MLAQWGALAVDCGVICDIVAAQAPVTVHASASRSWMRVTGRITRAERDLVTTDADLTVTCDDVETLGKTVHNGVAWDKFFVTLADDAATSFTPPKVNGIVEVHANGAGGRYVLAQYSTPATADAEALVVGSKGNVVITDGTLTGTDGTDVKVNVRADSSSAKVYIENRTGVSQTFIITFRDAIAD